MKMTSLTRADWRGYRQDEFPERSWRWEEDGLQALADGPPIDLVSRRRYGDFSFEFEWRLSEGGNSGVLYRVCEDHEHAWQSGPEMQLLDDPRHPDGANPTTCCGALYGLLPCALTEPLPPGLYIAGRLVAQGTQIEHWLAGQEVLRYDLSDPALRRHIAASRFKDYPRFGTVPDGHLVLQHHGSAVAFRNLRVGRLRA